jgi:inhibitor of KinA sporulation pathway (predicted exonuclease)
MYRVDTRAVGATFATLVRPRVNPVLSAYCTELLHIPQHEIDASDELPAALGRLERWLRDVAADGLPTCSWGPIDRVRLATNARMRGVADPLVGRAHIDLRDVMTALRDHPTPIARDELRDLANLPPNPRRHRALDDALDLTHFLSLLFAAR